MKFVKETFKDQFLCQGKGSSMYFTKTKLLIPYGQISVFCENYVEHKVWVKMQTEVMFQ